jgi:hypothetical protein
MFGEKLSERILTAEARRVFAEKLRRKSHSAILGVSAVKISFN